MIRKSLKVHQKIVIHSLYLNIFLKILIFGKNFLCLKETSTFLHCFTTVSLIITAFVTSKCLDNATQMWFVCSKNSHFIVLLFMEWSIKMFCLYFQWCNLWLSINSEETFDTSRYCYFVAWQVEGYVYGYVLRFVKKLILRTSMILHLNTELRRLYAFL